jgi:hypothetical protein
MKFQIKTLKMLVKGFTIGSVAGITLGTTLSLVMPPNETYTSFSFKQNVGLSSNPKTPIKFQIGNNRFTAYKIDEERLARSIASKEAAIASINRVNAKEIIASSEIEELSKKAKIEKTN